jgi:hypothetical protein
MKPSEAPIKTLFPEPLHDQEWAASIIGCKPKTLEAWRTRGGGPPFVRVGRLAKYRGSDLHAWIEQNVRRSTSEAGK